MALLCSVLMLPAAVGAGLSQTNCMAALDSIILVVLQVTGWSAQQLGQPRPVPRLGLPERPANGWCWLKGRLTFRVCMPMRMLMAWQCSCVPSGRRGFGCGFVLSV